MKPIQHARRILGRARRRISPAGASTPQPAPKPHKIFGIGLPKTGTTTLGHCLRTLGYRHTTFDPELTIQVRRGNVQAALDKARDYDAFEDWPWFLVYESLFRAFPDAKFILTVRRDEQTYVESLRRYRERKGAYSEDFDEPWWWREAIGYAPGYWDSAQMIAGYRAHNQSVMDFFAPWPDRLAVMCWEDGDRWERLCGFIDEPLPTASFPHLNKTR